jgi:methyl-accepting chemotaxis protein
MSFQGALDTIDGYIEDLESIVDGEFNCDRLELMVSEYMKSVTDLLNDKVQHMLGLISKYAPILELPSDPLKILKWAKKVILGVAEPAIEAAIRIATEIALLASKIASLAGAIATAATRLASCITELVESTLRDLSDSVMDNAMKVFEEARSIYEGLLDGLIGSNDSVTNAINALNTEINSVSNSVDSIQGSVDTISNVQIPST